MPSTREMGTRAGRPIALCRKRLSGAVMHGSIRNLYLSPLARVMAAYFGANGVNMVLHVVSGLLSARWAGPENMGRLLAVAVFGPYAGFVAFGVTNAVARQLPLLKGQGKHDEAARIVNTAWWWVRHTGFLIGAPFFVAGGVFLARGDGQVGSAWIAFSLLVPIEYYRQFHRVTYRTSGDFVKLSRIRMLTAALAIPTLLLVLWSPWWGLLIRAVLLDGTEYLLLRLWQSIKVQASFDRNTFRDAVRIGVPMFGVGYLQNILKGFDRTLMLLFAGSRGVGLYAPALQIARAAIVLPMSVDQVLYPRMCIEYGRSGTARSMARLAFLPTLVLAVCMLPMVLLGWWLVVPFVNTVLPDYTGGIAAAQWMLVLVYARCLSTPRIVLTVLYKLHVAAFCIVLSGLASFGLCSVLYSATSMGVAAIPAGCAGGALFYSLANAAAAAYYIFRQAGARRPAGEIPVPSRV